jgi:hypothetical protein
VRDLRTHAGLFYMNGDERRAKMFKSIAHDIDAMTKTGNTEELELTFATRNPSTSHDC